MHDNHVFRLITLFNSSFIHPSSQFDLPFTPSRHVHVALAPPSRPPVTAATAHFEIRRRSFAFHRTFVCVVRFRCGNALQIGACSSAVVIVVVRASVRSARAPAQPSATAVRTRWRRAWRQKPRESRQASRASASVRNGQAAASAASSSRSQRARSSPTSVRRGRRTDDKAYRRSRCVGPLTAGRAGGSAPEGASPRATRAARVDVVGCGRLIVIQE